MDLGTLSLRRGYLCRRCLAITVAYLALMALFGVALHSNSRNNNLNEGNFVHQFFGSFDANDLNVLSLARRYSVHSELSFRQKLLESVCEKYSDPINGNYDKVTVKFDQTRWYYMKKPNFMICMIPKVASTSLGNFIIGVHQIAKGGAIHNLGFSGNYSNNVNKMTYRTMVVRHPLDRIISAYKFIFHDEVKRDENRTKLYSNLTRLLLQNYREDPDLKNDFVTFPEFVRYLLIGEREETLEGDWLFYPGHNDSKFWIVDPNLNAHWEPYWKMCSPCHQVTQPINVIKLDAGNFKEEVDFIFEESGVYDFFRERGVREGRLSVPWKNKNSESQNDESKESIWKKYYSQISQSDVRGLYQKYQLDHELFGYQIQPFLSYAKKEEED